jgi:vacuolar-type H+-ATPase subunit F/Vma7
MSAPIFIGDEISASAYRLAGAEVRTPTSDELAATIKRAFAESDLVLITAQYAQRLPADELAQMQAQLHPLVLVVPDVRERAPLPDYANQLRRQLGIEA